MSRPIYYPDPICCREPFKGKIFQPPWRLTYKDAQLSKSKFGLNGYMVFHRQHWAKRPLTFAPCFVEAPNTKGRRPAMV